MSVEAIVRTVKDHLLQGDTAKALDKLIAFLEEDEKYEKLLHLSITARSEYSRLQTEQSQGLISPDDANARLNRLNARLLDIADRLADGRLEVEELQNNSGRKGTKKMLLIGIPLLLLIGAYLGYRFWPSDSSQKVTCPSFSPKAEFRVLLLPFKSISGDALRAEYVIKQRLDDLAYEKNLPVGVQIFERFYDLPNAGFPGFRQAQKIGNRCNADLILWGTAEETPDDRIVLTSKFKFLGNKQAFQIKKIELEGETDLVAVNSISSILEEGSFTEDVETLILAFYGLMAHQEGQYAEAIEAFESIAKKGSMPLEIVHTILADSYLAMDKPKKAAEHYEQVSRLKPLDTIVLNNLAWLQISLDNPEKAVEAAGQILQLDPQNKSALLTRAYAYLDARKYEQAAEDFSQLERLKSQNTNQQNKDSLELNDPQITPKTPRPSIPETELYIKVDPEMLKRKPPIRKDKIRIKKTNR